MRPLPRLLAATPRWQAWAEPEVRPDPDLLFFNGLGGFTPDGREYRLIVRDADERDVRRNGRLLPRATPRLALPPAPWINVVANPSCGFLVSEAGSGYTWAGNS